MKTKTTKVKNATVDFSTTVMSQVLHLQGNGSTLQTLLGLTQPEAEDIFEDQTKWMRDNKWYLGARHHWKGWLEYVNSHLFFRPEEHRMDQKLVMAAVRTWEGVKGDWSLVVQQKVIEEIQTRKTHHPTVLHLYSAFFISCLCQKASSPIQEIPTQLVPYTRTILPKSQVFLKLKNGQKLPI